MTPTRVFLLLGACIGLALCQAQTFQPEQQSWLRFAHAWPVNQQFDIFFDNLPTPIWNRVGFTHVTSYVPIEPGMVNVSIRAWGPHSTLIPLQQQGASSGANQSSQAMPLGSFTLGAGQFHTLALFHSPQAMQPTETSGTESSTSMSSESSSESATSASSSESATSASGSESATSASGSESATSASSSESATSASGSESATSASGSESATSASGSEAMMTSTSGESMAQLALEERQGWKLFLDQNIVQGDLILFRFLQLSADAPALRLVLVPSQMQPTGATPSLAREVIFPPTIFLNDSQYMQVQAGSYDISIMSGQGTSTSESETSGTSGTMASSTSESEASSSESETSGTMATSASGSETSGTSGAMATSSSSEETSGTGTESAQATGMQGQPMQLLTISNVLLRPGNIYSLFGMGMESAAGTESSAETQGTSSMQSGTQMQNFGFQGVLKFDNWALIPGQAIAFPQGTETGITSATSSESASATGSETGSATGSETGSATGSETGSATGSETGSATGSETGSESAPSQ